MRPDKRLVGEWETEMEARKREDMGVARERERVKVGK